MPYIEVNAAQIYYESFGQDKSGKAPIILIHGSTSTGGTDWNIAAPILARDFRVIVPDCRGHGRSTNPHLSYSFKEMADDIAALVHALGFQKAHIIGHSNGGNVALVVLMEHPEVVQTAVLQAANAYVSPDLVEKEPALFDPERVERENPQWMNEMIALHAPTHGLDYWRDLLRMTVKEIISEPNYTPEALKRVESPVLIIQGENDRVNAPASHAQFMAENIPHAELWIPAGIGHSVHKEILLDWASRVTDFLNRRGDDFNESLHRLHQKRFPDERETVFDVRAQTSDQPGKVDLIGQVLTVEQHQAALECLAQVQPATESSARVNFDVEGLQVLLNETTPWALVNRAVTNLRRQSRNGSELVSQGLLGEAVRILQDLGEWVFIKLDHDGYLGWMQSAALHRCSQAKVEDYQRACNAKVVAELLRARTSPQPNSDPESAGYLEAGKLPFSLRVPIQAWDGDNAQIRLPDDRTWWVESSGLLALEQYPQPNLEGIAYTLRLMRRFIGVPYLWGGRTPFGFDCSGFSQAFHSFLGINIPRDADQQYRAGAPVEGTPQPGDLLFFGERAPRASSSRYANITHVAISLGGDEIIHANGATWSVAYNSLNPQNPYYRAWLRTNLVGVRRFL